MDITIGFLGLGLIGGSIAKGIKRHHKNYRLIAYNHHYETAEAAVHDGTIDIAVKDINETFSACDIIYLCMPVSYNVSYLKKLKPYLKETCILTDVGSVKENIHQAAEALGLQKYFIGGHPMAGSEKTGYENATDHLVENAYYALTPFPETDEKKLQQLEALTSSLGAIPVILQPKQHDYAVAAISHLPHMIASGLVNLVKKLDSKEEIMKTIAAGGFKDITRIASSSPVMWQQICLTNAEAITSLMNDYIQYFEEIRDAVVRKDQEYLFHFFEQGREYRNSIPNRSSGLIQKVPAVYCDLVDEAGSIAKAATLLAEHQISIKNIGITHTREFQEEVLKIEFYTEEAAVLAEDILKQHQYIVSYIH